MQMPLEPLLALDEIIEGKSTRIEVRQEVADDNGVIAHITLVQAESENRTYDMRLKSCNEPLGEEPRWQFVSEVPQELKEIEWTISEAIFEKDM